MKHPVVITALLCLLLTTLAEAESYQVVTEEWAPYNYEENGQLTGMATEVVRAIMAQLGDEFEVVLLPSMRATWVLQTQPRSIMFSMFRTAEREQLYKWVGPIAQESFHPYQLASAPTQINTLEQLLRAPKITTRHGGLVPDVLQALGFANLDKSATESELLYRMLLAGRTDIIIGDTDTGAAYYAGRLNIAPGTLRRIPIEIFRAPLYIAFSRDSDDAQVARWSEALESLRNSGELQRIQHRYQRQPVE